MKASQGDAHLDHSTGDVIEVSRFVGVGSARGVAILLVMGAIFLVCPTPSVSSSSRTSVEAAAIGRQIQPKASQVVQFRQTVSTWPTRIRTESTSNSSKPAKHKQSQNRTLQGKPDWQVGMWWPDSHRSIEITCRRDTLLHPTNDCDFQCCATAYH
jgi:hypothetical protein